MTFDCTLCPQKYESEDSLYPHYLFEHGVYRQSCSTDVALKQYEEQLELQSRYNLLLSNLRSIIRVHRRAEYDKFYHEKKHFYTLKEAQVLRKRLLELNAVIKEIPDACYLDYSLLKDPGLCASCNYGHRHACKREFKVNIGGQRMKFLCKCECNKCEKCNRQMQIGHILKVYILKTEKKPGKWIPTCRAYNKT